MPVARPELPPSLPHHLELLAEVEARRNALQADGYYAQAGKVQAQLEATKHEQETAELKALADKHENELIALEEDNKRAFDEMIGRHDYMLMLLARHGAAQEDFKRKCDSEPVRHRASKQLLDMRVQEDHLRRQCTFQKADKVKAAADALQSHEIAEAAAMQIARQESEESKLVIKQHKEIEVLRKKAQASFNDLLLDHERELDHLKKKMQVAKNSLLRAHAQERLLLEQAFRGWFNPRKLLSAKPHRITTSQIHMDEINMSLGTPYTARSAVGSVRVNSTHISSDRYLHNDRHTPFTNLSAASSPPATPATPTGRASTNSSSRNSSSLALALQPKSSPHGIMSLIRPSTSPMRRALSPSRAQHQTSMGPGRPAGLTQQALREQNGH